MNFDSLLALVGTYNNNPDELKQICEAYNYASYLHRNQFRQSGEAYIIHPLSVAYILVTMRADSDTICAALLHDVVEDTDTNLEEIEGLFNKDISLLVDGVTKIKRMNFTTKTEQNSANTRKIIMSIKEDIRIIIIKLADRLHNMRTLQYKSEFKQKENALETMNLYVPLAYYIGAYRIKNELEDLALQYLYPNTYKEISEERENIYSSSKENLEEIKGIIHNNLLENNINNYIKMRVKNVYGIYKSMKNNKDLSSVHDLLSLKIMVDNVDECYKALSIIHKQYHPINSKFKDYICNPKTNMYQSLHTTVFGPGDKLIQTQIRTFDMDKIASFGLIAYWDINKGNAREVMQQNLKNKCQFLDSLLEIDEVFRNNQDFVNHVRDELLSDRVYAYTTNGDVIALPNGSTAVDFAYRININAGHNLDKVIVNNREVGIDYVLKNKDRVQIITGNNLDNSSNLEDNAKTTLAKRRIMKLKR